MTDNYALPNGKSDVFSLKLKLPDGVSCKQCVLQVCTKKSNSQKGHVSISKPVLSIANGSRAKTI